MLHGFTLLLERSSLPHACVCVCMLQPTLQWMRLCDSLTLTLIYSTTTAIVGTAKCRAIFRLTRGLPAQLLPVTLTEITGVSRIWGLRWSALQSAGIMYAHYKEWKERQAPACICVHYKGLRGKMQLNVGIPP